MKICSFEMLGSMGHQLTSKSLRSAAVRLLLGSSDTVCSLWAVAPQVYSTVGAHTFLSPLFSERKDVTLHTLAAFAVIPNPPPLKIGRLAFCTDRAALSDTDFEREDGELTW